MRAYVLRERLGVPRSAALATIAVERVFDGLTMLGFLLTASLFIPFNEQLRRLAFLAAAVFGALLLALAVVVRSGPIRARLLALLARFLPGALAGRVAAVVEGFVGGLQILRSAGDLAAVALLSVLAWTLESAMYLVLAPGLGVPLGPAGALLTTAVANLATLIPSTPGYVGVFEGGVLLVLNGLFAIDSELALSYAIAVHAALYFPVTLWGLYYWTRAHLSWRTMRQERDLDADAGAPRSAGAMTTE